MAYPRARPRGNINVEDAPMVMTPEDSVLSIIGWRPTGDLGGLTAYTSKRGKVVWFLKAPPTCPPSYWQIHQRNVFRLIAMAWKAFSDDRREQWHLAEVRGNLNITGYNLFTWWCINRDHAIIHTIERQTGTSLIS